MTELDMRIIGAGNDAKIEITLPENEIETLFDKAFEGWCPICRNTKISGDESICCGCLEDAIKYHKRLCTYHELLGEIVYHHKGIPRSRPGSLIVTRDDLVRRYRDEKEPSLMHLDMRTSSLVEMCDVVIFKDGDTLHILKDRF